MSTICFRYLIKTIELIMKTFWEEIYLTGHKGDWEKLLGDARREIEEQRALK